jgi:hypothetical protein
MAGHDYFLLSDRVMNPAVGHRLSWFVRKGSEMPTLKFVRGFDASVRETQRTDLQTAATTGTWFDGVGDSVVVVSHRKDLEVETTGYGCRVRSGTIDDYLFSSPTLIHFSEAGVSFEGTSGLVRLGKDAIEFALFHGSSIGVGGLTFGTMDAELGIGGMVVAGKVARGVYLAPKASSLKIAMTPAGSKTVFYVDGKAVGGLGEGGELTLELAAGKHHWELTAGLPVPLAPRIVRTENVGGGARVFVERVDGAARYRLELRRDGGVGWESAATAVEPEMAVRGIADGEKVHVRAVALNGEHESEPGAAYPIYGTKRAPDAPDGLRVELAEGVARVTWGEILGVSEYRLYGRGPGSAGFEVLYRGLERAYVDLLSGVHGVSGAPQMVDQAMGRRFFEYCVTAVNGNGEGVRSRVADTNPAAWRNWDPRPGEGFRRVSSFVPGSAVGPEEWARYYPD